MAESVELRITNRAAYVSMQGEGRERGGVESENENARKQESEKTKKPFRILHSGTAL
ncbi:hypothetical protein [Paraburkholderia sp. BL23I1N1]|uniref:hypothetical protein n=1 Tax=Paraburkholderia sp. BL23I1N1 TaxID=1938802 RepID=UPI001600ACA4|nr:hypothetical protein [Paraburkholderia sp. BL23I1N1]